MFHKPTCPYYHDIRLPACTCLPPTPIQTSIPRRSSALQEPPPSYPAVLLDAVQSTRLVRRAISRGKHHLDEPWRDGKHVHFTTPPQPRHDTPTSRRAYIPNPLPTRAILLTPDIPTIYIVTFATDSFPLTQKTIKYLLTTQIPGAVPHLYTLTCHAFTPPPSAMCAVYSGISPLIQDIVLSDPCAAKAVHTAVRRILDEGKRGVRECSLSVCCHAGTHRSVAVGERIAQGVKAGVRKGGGEVRVVVRHVSRIKGRGDPF